MTCIKAPIYCFGLFLLLIALVAKAQQGGTTRYVYDNNGRLRAVLAPNGEAALYDYDPAGNLTAIRRLAATACEALEFTPQQGTSGAQVTIYGVGFGGQVRGVSFNGLAAQIVSQTPISVTVRVPDQATTGPLALTLPCGIKTFATPFTVSGVRVTPSALTLFPGRSVQFLADVMGIADPSVEWSVNGSNGGNTAVGTIARNGFYLAPALPTGTSTAQFTVRAASAADPSIFGEAQVKVTTNGYEFLSQGVSVRFAPPPARAFAAVFNAVSVTRGASVAAIALDVLARGQSIALTIHGAQLADITDIRFINEDGSEEKTITAADLKVAADGTLLTGRIRAEKTARPGRRTLRLYTAEGLLRAAATLEVIP